MKHIAFDTQRTLTTQSGQTLTYHSLKALEDAGFSQVSSLPVSLRIVLESVMVEQRQTIWNQLTTDAHQIFFANLRMLTDQLLGDASILSEHQQTDRVDI